MVSIIVINYNTFDFTVACIRSIQFFTKAVPYEIILVDNASTEKNPDEFLQIFPNIRLIKSTVNSGFSKGNNLGIDYATGNIILLLNSDTYLIEDAISKAMLFLAAHPEIGVLSVSLKYPDGRPQHYTRRFRSITNELLDMLRPLLYLLPYRRRARMMLNQYYNGDFDVAADWIGGAFFMFPAKVLQQLPGGRLDERYFMYGEDQLWCYQIAQVGYKCYNYSGTSVVHIEGGSTLQRKPRFQKELLERDITVYRWMGAGSFRYAILKAIFFTKKYVAYLIKRARFALQ